MIRALPALGTLPLGGGAAAGGAQVPQKFLL